MRISDWSSDVCSSDLTATRSQTIARPPFDSTPSRDGPRVNEMITSAQVRLVDENGEQVGVVSRSEEHTSELQSLMRISYAVFCLKKKKTTIMRNTKNSLTIKR